MRYLTIISALLCLSVARLHAQRDTTHYRVQSIGIGGAVHLASSAHPAVTVHADSLSRSVRVGDFVRRCRRPVRNSTRVVTWCIDHKASGRK